LTVLSPLVLGKSLRPHPLVVLLSFAVGTVVAGIVGAFVAVPLTAVAVSVTRSLRADQDPRRRRSTRRSALGNTYLARAPSGRHVEGGNER